MSERILVWYSDGAASAVAAKYAIKKYSDRVEIYKSDTTINEHPDNIRFRLDVEEWLGKEIKLISSTKYKTIDEVFEQTRYMAGVRGARCTTELKKLPRYAITDGSEINIFGYTYEEQNRIFDFEERNPEIKCDWILRDNFILKRACFRILNEANIKLPAMYTLGFEHNNCLGCVKATSPAYWNRTRRLFPSVFARRMRLSRELGVRLVRLRGERLFLDELPTDAGLDESDGNIECGVFCQSGSLE